MKLKLDHFKKYQNLYLQNYSLSNDKVQHLKAILKDIIFDVHRVCEKYNVFYSAAFGTVLGAVRHQGFIPWDDDLDIYSDRKNFILLCKYLDIEYPNKYFYSIPGYVKHDPCRFGKIMLKNTKYIEVDYAGCKKISRGIGIDVFLLDHIPNSKFPRFLAKQYNKFLSIACSSSFDFKYPSPIILEESKKSKELKKYYNKRRFIGFFFSWLPIRWWVKLHVLSSKICKNSNFLCSKNSAYSFKNIYDKSLFENMIDVKFEDIQIKIPKNYEAYLKKVYGDWRIIPKDADKQVHILVDIDFGCY